MPPVRVTERHILGAPRPKTQSWVGLPAPPNARRQDHLHHFLRHVVRDGVVILLAGGLAEADRRFVVAEVRHAVRAFGEVPIELRTRGRAEVPLEVVDQEVGELAAGDAGTRLRATSSRQRATSNDQP